GNILQRAARSFFSDDKVTAPPVAVLNATATLFPPAQGHVTQAPLAVPPVLQNTRFIVYAFYGPNTPLPETVTVKADSPDGPLELALPLRMTTAGAASCLCALRGR